MLDTIPINWYLEIELCHGTTKWHVLRESFLLTLSFEDEFDSIDEALQEIKVSIFRTPKEPSRMDSARLEYTNVPCRGML